MAESPYQFLCVCLTCSELLLTKFHPCKGSDLSGAKLHTGPLKNPEKHQTDSPGLQMDQTLHPKR